MFEPLIDDIRQEIDGITSGIRSDTREVLLHDKSIVIFLQALGNLGYITVPKEASEEVSPTAQYELESIIRMWVTSTGTDLDVPAAQILSELRSRGWRILPPT